MLVNLSQTILLVEARSMRGLRIIPLSTPALRQRIVYQLHGKPISTISWLSSLRFPYFVPIEDRTPQISTGAIEARRHYTIKATADALLPSFRPPVLIMADKKGGKQATLGYVRDSQSTIGCVAVVTAVH